MDIKTKESNKNMELVALGASIGGNCVPCLEWHFQKCVEIGISKDELKEAIKIANQVKQAPIKKINEVADQLLKKMEE